MSESLLEAPPQTEAQASGPAQPQVSPIAVAHHGQPQLRRRPDGPRTPLAVSVSRVLTGAGLYLLLFLLWSLVVSAIPQARSQEMLLSELRTKVLTQAAVEEEEEGGFSGVLVGGEAQTEEADEAAFEAAPEPPAPGEPVALLSIDAIGVQQVVVQGTTSAQLDDGPGHFRNTILPGQLGNSAIAGTRVSNGGVFRHLDDLVEGDEIRVVTAQGSFTYEVVEVVVAAPGDPDPVRPTRDARLTLITSDPPLLSRDELTVTARLTSQPVRPLAGQRAVAIDESERNGSPDAGSIARFLVFLQLFLIALIGARRLYATWSPWPTWLISTPVLLLLLILSFEAFAGLLPATF